MKRMPLILVLALVAVAGFILGRATAGTPISEVVNTARREIPLFPAPPKPTEAPPKPAEVPQDDAEIVLEVPVDGATVPDSFIDVAGRAVTGAPLSVILRASDGRVIAETTAEVAAAAGGTHGRFARTITFDEPQSGAATLEVFRDPAKKVVRAVAFASPDDSVSVRVYFGNMALDPDNTCTLVYPVERTVSHKAAIYRAVIEELLKGPTEAEKQDRYFTSLPAGVILKSVAADAQGVVTANFTESLERGVGGSCRVAAIRAQISATLKQFPEVRDVIISVNGRVEDVLQP